MNTQNSYFNDEEQEFFLEFNPSAKYVDVQFEESDSEFDPAFGEIQTVVEGGTKNHPDLMNRDAPDQHPISAITGLAEALMGVSFETDETLFVKNGVLGVNTAKEVGASTLPVTAAAVDTVVGNIEVLLGTI